MGQSAQPSKFTYRRRQPEDAVLYRVLAANVETFIADRELEGRAVPSRVAKELRAYLKCGILHYGFVRVVCPGCQFEMPVGYSCKGRGFCPSCCGKRMAEAVEHLIDHVLPVAPYRQWVLTFPFALRFWLAANSRLSSKINKIATSEIAKFYMKKARAEGVAIPLPGAITFIQRSGSALNAALHLHILALDGVFSAPKTASSQPCLHALSGPSDLEVGEVVERISKRTIKLLRRRGYLDSAAARLELQDSGDIVYKLKRVFSDGTRAILLSPMELIERLCAMIPPPRAHQVLYTGVFSSRSKWRNLVVLNREARKGFNPITVDKKKVKNHRWAKLLMRIFKTDVGACPKCNSDMEIRAAVHDPESIRRYLKHIGLSEHPPPIAPARYGPLELGLGSAETPPPNDDAQIMPNYYL